MTAAEQFKRFKVLERPNTVTPLGLRFWDEVSGKTIGDGLSVFAFPANNPARRVEAFVSASGVNVLRNLPGTRAVENQNLEFGDRFPTIKSFVIEVTDLEGRFLPFTLKVELPLSDVFTWQNPFDSSPPRKSVGIPLYSAPTRQAPTTMAVVRAELREWVLESNHEGAPAAWAMLEARVSNRTIGRGFADQRGRVALIFPYPEPITHTLGSPPGSVSPPSGNAPPLKDQEWTIELAASYGQLTRESVPDLNDVLNQPAATVWEDSERGRQLSEARLGFGRELILRSRDFAAEPEGAPLSLLFITAAGSPP